MSSEVNYKIENLKVPMTTLTSAELEKASGGALGENGHCFGDGIIFNWVSLLEKFLKDK